MELDPTKEKIMKELILRDIYLIRKNLLITFGIFAAFFLLGLITILSCKYGNIAKYALDEEMINETLNMSSAFGIFAGIMLGTAVEHVYSMINKDYKCGWHGYLKASGIRPEVEVGVKYISVTIIGIICILMGLGSCHLLKYLSGVNEGLFIKSGTLAKQEGMIVSVWFTCIVLILGAYFSTLEYAYKGKNNTKTDLIKMVPVTVITLVTLIVAQIFLQDEEASRKLLKALLEKANNVTLLYMVPIVEAILVNIICYLISVRLVKKEGKRV